MFHIKISQLLGQNRWKKRFRLTLAVENYWIRPKILPFYISCHVLKISRHSQCIPYKRLREVPRFIEEFFPQGPNVWPMGHTCWFNKKKLKKCWPKYAWKFPMNCEKCQKTCFQPESLTTTTKSLHGHKSFISGWHSFTRLVKEIKIVVGLLRGSLDFLTDDVFCFYFCCQFFP